MIENPPPVISKSTGSNDLKPDRFSAGDVWGGLAAAAVVLPQAMAFGVALLVLLSAWNLIREALDVLMETVPPHLDPQEIRDQLLNVPGVSALHCLHVWTIGSSEVSLSSHLVVDADRDTDVLLRDVRDRLAERFEIEHTTIQIEVSEPGSESDPACGEVCEPATGGPIPSTG